MAIDQAQRQDNRIQEYQDWFNIKDSNGWLIYKKELEGLIEHYVQYMNNPEADGDMLKRYQLIKKGLLMALDIPKVLENKAKMARKENR